MKKQNTGETNTKKKQAKQKSNVTINYLSGHNDYHDDHDDHGDDDDHDKPTNKAKIVNDSIILWLQIFLCCFSL